MGSQAPKCYVESGPQGSIEIPIVITGKTSIKALDCVNHFHTYLLVPTWLIYNTSQVLLRTRNDTFKSFRIQLYACQNFEQDPKYFKNLSDDCLHFQVHICTKNQLYAHAQILLFTSKSLPQNFYLKCNKKFEELLQIFFQQL